MTREEILKKYLSKSQYTYPLAGNEWILVYDAMGLFAKQEAILFGQWATHNDYTYIPNKGYWVNYEEEENDDTYTDDEMIDKYLKYKNIKT